MSEFYELIQTEKGFPVKTFIHGVNRLEMHWHNAIEILFVLKGSINITVRDQSYLLKENDLILINNMEIHSINKTKEDNILLALQINSDHYNEIYPGFSDIIFDCNSSISDNQEKFDIVRKFLAEIIWVTNKTKKGNNLIIASKINLLTYYLLDSFSIDINEDKKEKSSFKDIKRMKQIIEYINKNLDKKITLKEIAEREDLSLYYLSRFFKKKIGISFQEYLNITRLEKARKLLITTNINVTDIVFRCGFSSTNYFNKIFKKEYNCTPSEYRNKNSQKNKDTSKIRAKTYLDVDRKAAFKTLFKYLNLGNNNPNSKENNFDFVNNRDSITTKISIDINNTELTYYKPYWKKLITFGRAKEGLMSSVQNQLKEIQREIGFEYIRFHGIFMDEMMIYHLNKDGSVSYNWTYVDQLFDFFMDINIKPFIELGLMPSELKRSDETVHWWKGNISPPKDIKLWTDLVQAFVKHCINRYGLKEVKTWYFEVWNEPELHYVFWAGTKEEYFEFFRETQLSIKSIHNHLKVGGPSISHGVIINSTWLDGFLSYCNKEGIALDFISAHIYTEYIPSEEFNRIERYLREDNSNLDSVEFKTIYHNKDHSYNTINRISHKSKEILNFLPEIHITEWNASSQLGNLIHDTAFISSYIIKNILQCINTVDSLGYWVFTDIFEEKKLSQSHFHGGFGLINKDGLKKASYYAYYLLNKLGPCIIEQGDDYIITKSDDDIQILVYNYAHFDQLFLSGDTSALTHKNRYEIYEEKQIKEIEIKLKGLDGKYKITRYTLNRENGSVFDEWIKLNAPENMTKEEIDYLKGISRPKVHISNLDIKVEYREKLSIPVHGIELITIKKLF